LLRAIDPTRVLEPQQLLDLTNKASRNRKLATSLQSELAKYGLDSDVVLGEAFLLCCGEIERLHKMLSSTEARRNVTIRTFHDYRNMRLAARSLIDATDATVVCGS
jgi:hypothetical protein